MRVQAGSANAKRQYVTCASCERILFKCPLCVRRAHSGKAPCVFLKRVLARSQSFKEERHLLSFRAPGVIEVSWARRAATQSAGRFNKIRSDRLPRRRLCLYRRALPASHLIQQFRPRKTRNEKYSARLIMPARVIRANYETAINRFVSVHLIYGPADFIYRGAAAR